MNAVFFILAALTITGMAAAMSLRHLVHCILALTLGFAGLAALYLQLGAQFVGFTQILVYIGAVAILAVFAIMMTRSAGPAAPPARSSFWLTGSIVATAVFAVLAWAICSTTASTQALPPKPEASVNQIGDALMHRFILPLEIMGLLLTAALIGAVILAMQEKQEVR
jgi:NADH-quinone oxidoreductase subunit J